MRMLPPMLALLHPEYAFDLKKMREKMSRLLNLMPGEQQIADLPEHFLGLKKCADGINTTVRLLPPSGGLPIH